MGDRGNYSMRNGVVGRPLRTSYGSAVRPFPKGLDVIPHYAELILIILLLRARRSKYMYIHVRRIDLADAPSIHCK